MIFKTKKTKIVNILLLFLLILYPAKTICGDTENEDNNTDIVDLNPIFNIPGELNEETVEETDDYIAYHIFICDYINDIEELAYSFEGRSGSCFQIASDFLCSIWDMGKLHICEDEWKEIPDSAAEPGDLIYYEDGGLGSEHWAIYVGKDLALHGSFNGQAKVTKIYLANASRPIFLRYIGGAEFLISHFDD